MKKSLTPKILLMALLLLAINTAKAQVSALSGLASGTLAMYCPAEQVKLTSASTGAASYVWKRYAGKTATGTPVTLTDTTASITDTPPDPGYYTYVSTGLNALHCESSVSDPAVIYILPGISASIASATPATTQYCESAVPGGLTLTATPGKTGTTVNESFAYAYQWFKNGTAITNANSSTYTLNSANDAVVGNNIAYTVQITYAITGKNCAATTSSPINYNVLALPAKPSITITP